jgi:dihydropteroate synthase
MERIGVDPAGARIMAPKQHHYNLKVEDLTPMQANIIKQDILSIGGEAAVSKGVVSCSVESTGAIVSGTRRQLERLVAKLKGQSYGLSDVACAIELALHDSGLAEYTLKGASASWKVGPGTLVMGILNTTPDSFSDGGEYAGVDHAARRAIELAEHADWIDIGGESTRPGAEPVSVDEEISRVVPVVEALAGRGLLISIDTMKAEVARRALEAGASMINDVSALESDPEMAAVCAEYGCPVVLMHMRGTPRSMQERVHYDDLIGEIFSYLSERVEFAVSRGIERESIIIDPGLGFGKSVAGNFEILNSLREFRSIGRPVLVGPSRKSFVGAAAGDPDPAGETRLAGTLASVAAAVLNGASIIRAHDAREARAAVSVADAIRSAEEEE